MFLSISVFIIVSASTPFAFLDVRRQYIVFWFFLLVVWFIGVHAYGWDHVFIFLMALRRRYHCVIIGLQFLSVSQVTAFGWVAKVDVAGWLAWS